MSEIDFQKLRRLDFALLLVFREVFRSGSSTMAANRLGLSQPAISHALNRLRDLIGDPLFLRRANGFRPTPAATDLAPRIEALIASAGEMLGAAPPFDAATSERLFRVAANDFAGSLLTAPLIADIAARAPRARLSFRFSIGPVAFKALRENELDVGMGLFNELPDDIVGQPLFEETYCVVARIGHPALRAGLDLATFLELGHLLVSFVGDLTGSIDATLKRQGLSRRIVAGSPMFLNAFAAVACSDLIATVPRRLAQRFAPGFGLQIFPPPLRIEPFTVELIRSRLSLGDPAVDWIAERIAVALQQAPATV
jgi:DNA-binding transcriptional LysR family regulator